MNIHSFDLFIKCFGVECAMYPCYYPTTDFTDTGIVEALKAKYPDDNRNRVISIGQSWTRKVLSSARVYGAQRNLPFFLFEKHLANKYFAAHVH